MGIKKEVANLWVKALLGGQYEQANGKFIEGDPTEPGASYCCLAVLTDVAIKEGLDTVRWVKGSDEPEIFIPVDEMDESINDYEEDRVVRDGRGEALGVWQSYGDADLPDPVRKWAGLVASNPLLNGKPAIVRNDDDCETFEEIAHAIALDAGLA
jgi:hypothetical protein